MAKTKPVVGGRIICSASWENTLKNPADQASWDVQVQACFAQIRSTKAGRALIKAITRAPKILLVVPDPKAELNAFATTTSPLESVPWKYWTDNTPFIGGGSCSIVTFSPNNFAGYHGVGSSPHAVLFHELCHGLHQMTGQMMNWRPLGANLDDLDEFFAIVASNIYSSELKYPYMRADHHGFTALNAYESTSQGFYDRWGPQIKEIIKTAPEFCRDLAKLDVKFNPIRYYYSTVAGAIPA